ncbi:ester cyclase [Oceanobacillus jeddahense]|uniref:Ester cyclase n=1 Tax=Oceanobacillus jeddahense TaxID=1462527 RepID=A0ABY5JV29_9BACI|nr:ester cyclase [Oceanobacillus jeddahense]UUI04176.1 ester cyclase [Oceanobacillus jeddahense]
MNGKEIYQVWMNAWNKDISLLHDITDESCTVHQARTDGKDSNSIKGVEALKDVVESAKYYFENVKMSLVVQPIEERNYVSARWNFKGIYNGNMVEAKAEKGKLVSFDGTDIFRIENGKIKDYWVSSDVIDFMNQLELF